MGIRDYYGLVLTYSELNIYYSEGRSKQKINNKTIKKNFTRVMEVIFFNAASILWNESHG